MLKETGVRITFIRTQKRK